LKFVQNLNKSSAEIKIPKMDTWSDSCSKSSSEKTGSASNAEPSVSDSLESVSK
jgi:hypothetical protein